MQTFGFFTRHAMTYTGRLAPSPTGYLHLGHAATFLAAGNRARSSGGRLLLRIDDLDPQRSKAVYEEAAKEDLRWLGLSWETEHRQSERLSLYRAAIDRLVRQEHVYPCSCTRKDLQAAMQAPHEDTDDEPIYPGRCRPRESAAQPGDKVPAPEGPDVDEGPFRPQVNYRFQVAEGAVVAFEDHNCGLQSFTAGVDFGDFLVWRKDGLPSYQLACVVDDASMGITEVVRGRDLLKSTARQILLQNALSLPTPAYFHTDLLCDAKGQRLAKRDDALSVRALRSQGATAAEILARVDALTHHTKA